jgi:Ca2+-transporting ATPase
MSEPVTAANIHASEASNLVFAGSTVAAGRGLGVVYATGTHTEFGQDANVFACRSERVSIFRLGFFSNRLIWLGIAVEWILILSIIFSPTLQTVFSTTPLKIDHWLMLLFCPLLILMADELRKRVIHRVQSF